MRIYIVEDDAEIRELESYALTSSGFDTVCFAEGASFLQALKREKPALVLLDVMLPGMSGLDLLRQIRSQADTASLPVILVTAKSSEWIPSAAWIWERTTILPSLLALWNW